MSSIEQEDTAPECGWCGDPIEGVPVYDESQVWYLGIARATPFHNNDCLNSAAEAQSEQRTHNFYAA
jgi:hypothetical protein